MARALPPGAGINALVALNAARVVELEVAEPGVLVDLDTPEDYQRWSGQRDVSSENEKGNRVRSVQDRPKAGKTDGEEL
jgi:hypothetical protein